MLSSHAFLIERNSAFFLISDFAFFEVVATHKCVKILVVIDDDLVASETLETWAA